MNTTTTLKNKVISLILALLLSTTYCFVSFSQHSTTIISELWEGTGGQGTMFNRNVTKIDAYSNVYVAGATINGFNNSDILIQKFDEGGTLLWQQEYAGAAGGNDFATDLFIDSSENVFLTGSIADTVSQGNDIVVIKYNNSGVFQWKKTYHGVDFLPDDSGTAITGDNAGKIYVAGTIGDSTSLYDFITIALNSNTGADIWSATYDYDQLLEIPSKIQYRSDSSVVITGASQQDYPLLRWEVATIQYSGTTGAILYTTRTNTSTISQSGADIGDIFIDDSDNLYITGALYNDTSSNNDIALIKFDSNLQLTDLFMYDFNGQDDYGKGIKVDDSSNVYITGYTTKVGIGKETTVIKVNNTGAIEWQREITGPNIGDNEGIQLILKDSVIFVVAKIKRNNNYDFDLYMLSQTDGEIITSLSYNAANLYDEPQAIAIDLNGDIVVTGIFQTGASTFESKTFKYKLYEKEFNPYYNGNGEPIYNQNELTIRFNKNHIKNEAVTRRNFIAGELTDFIDTVAISALNNKFGGDCSRLKTFKIFKRLTKADSLSVTRLGDTIKIDPFWATLSVMIPGDINLQQIIDSLETMKDIVLYAERNYFGKFDGVIPDDYYITHYMQEGLKGNNIGIELISYNSMLEMIEQGGWEFEIGKSDVKVGVYDSGINWRHEDLGDGTWSGSRVKGGWDYGKGIPPSTQAIPDQDGHGTAVAGIVGAIRNNGIGIAGIAGGDYAQNIDGVSLYSMRIANGGTLDPNDTLFDSNSTAEAILEGALNNTSTGFGFGLDVHNHSWHIINNSPEFGDRYHTLRNSMNTAFKNGCVQVASSGNLAWNEHPLADTAFYPASFNDEWILKTGALCSDGQRCGSSAYAYNIDIIAPGQTNLVNTLKHNENDGYIPFDGTSAAAPHASGVAALMLSMHNPDYNALYPNKLEQEDVEYILQKNTIPKTTDPIGGSGLPIPNQYSGYGLLNAYKSLMKSSLPYRIRHFEHTLHSDAATVYATGQNIAYPEGIDGVPVGSQIGTTTIYEITHTFNHSIPVEENFIAGWVRNSSSDLYTLTDTIYNSHWSGLHLNSIDKDSATLTGYYYVTQIITPDSTYYKIFPEPNTASEFKFSYSIHTIDTSYHYLGFSDNNINSEKIVIFPNPTNDFINIYVGGNEYNLTIYDITGREIEAMEFEKNTLSKTLDISDYLNGLYLFVFENNEHRIMRKIIKK